MDKKPPGIAEVLPTHTPGLFQAAVRRAAELLCGGEVVALPTETVYGLAASALDGRAVERIFQVKGRPAHNPIIVHVASVGMGKQCVASLPAPASLRNLAIGVYELERERKRTQADTLKSWCQQPTFSTIWPRLRRWPSGKRFHWLPLARGPRLGRPGQASAWSDI